MSLKPTFELAPQAGLINIQIDALLALNIHSCSQDKLKQIFESIKAHESRHIRNVDFYSIVQKIIESNICHKTSTTRIVFGLYERRTEINNHLLP